MARRARVRRGPARSFGRTAVDTFVFIVALAVALALLKFSGLLSIDEGPVRVIDGDSFWRGESEVRLHGIDAPEYRQTCKDEAGREWNCGREAMRALKDMIGGRDVVCEIRDTDRYDRLVAVCKSGDVDLNQTMVRQGWAVSFGGYGSAEAEARQAGRGIWRGEFERPQDWRRRHETSRSDAAGASAPND